MCVHITLEGLIARFDVAEVPDTEMSNNVEGVRSCAQLVKLPWKCMRISLVYNACEIVQSL